MNWEVFVTCAVTGAGDTAGRSAHVPVDARADRRLGDRGCPRRRGDRAHPRPRPGDGQGARDPALYRAVVERIRASGRRRRAQPHGGHGRRPRARRRRCAAAAGRSRHRHGGRGRAPRARRGAAARDLHARLRDDELRRRRRLRDGQHARDAARDGRARAGARRAPGARGVRHRPSRLRARADPRRADRRPAADPALHGHPLRRARRPRDVARDGQSAAGERDLLGVLDRPDAAAVRRARGDGRAATRASGSRTTSTSRAAVSRRTRSSSSARSRSSSR